MRGAPGGRGGRVGLVVVVVSIIVIVGSFLLRPHGPDSESASDARASDPATTESSAGPSAEPTEPTKRRKKRPDAAPSDGGPEGLPGSGGGLPGLGAPPGFGGTGGGVSLKEQRIHLQVFSRQPIGVIGYLVPTSLDKPSGTVRGVGTSWSMRTVAYGKPDYARLFFRAGPSGTPVSCIITVNGRVTERRSTSGPYGATMCQG